LLKTMNLELAPNTLFLGFCYLFQYMMGKQTTSQFDTQTKYKYNKNSNTNVM